MPSIQTSPYPLAFPVLDPDPGRPGIVAPTGRVRVVARALEGMQKEALVRCGKEGRAWRLVSDEGPYLEGTDLAPFPLAFFTTGLTAAYFSALAGSPGADALLNAGLRLVVDSRYTMAGSALKGTMQGDALCPQLRVEAPDPEPSLTRALDDFPIARWLSRAWREEFALSVNGTRVEAGLLPEFSGAREAAPRDFDHVRPPDPGGFLPDIVTKLTSAEAISGVEGGAGSSLEREQKRTIHVRGIGTLRPEGLVEVRIELFRPIGSSFRFLAAPALPSADERAPSAETYLAAGVAFCFLTQLGRYARIVRKPLDDYRIIQDMAIGEGNGNEPIRTQLFIETAENGDYGATLIRMGAQTCFLHAACQKPLSTEVST